jgi:hypothetical protein
MPEYEKGRTLNVTLFQNPSGERLALIPEYEKGRTLTFSRHVYLAVSHPMV